MSCFLHAKIEHLPLLENYFLLLNKVIALLGK